MNTYYVVIVNGAPEAVSADYHRAAKMQRELASANREATIVPCAPIPEQTQLDLPLEDEYSER